jgi:hypothetical protein
VELGLNQENQILVVFGDNFLAAVFLAQESKSVFNGVL